MNKEILIYQGKNGEILLREDGNNETIWATNIHREHITQGFTIHKSRIQGNYDKFLSVIEEVRKLLPKNNLTHYVTTQKLRYI